VPAVLFETGRVQSDTAAACLRAYQGKEDKAINFGTYMISLLFLLAVIQRAARVALPAPLNSITCRIHRSLRKYRPTAFMPDQGLGTPLSFTNPSCIHCLIFIHAD